MAGRIAYYGNIVKDGLVLCLDAAKRDSYPGSGTVWSDISGFNNHVTLYNGVSYGNNALTGNGTNSYGRTNSTLNLTGLSAITVVSVFKTPTTSSGGLVYEHTSNWNVKNSYDSVLYGGFGAASNANGSISVANMNHFQLNGNTNYSGADAIAPSTLNFQHYTAVHNFALSTDETSVYVNGNYTAKSTTPSPQGNTYPGNNTGTFVNDHFYLWSRAGTAGFSSASIALIHIYNRALSAQEILQNYNATKGRYGL